MDLGGRSVTQSKGSSSKSIRLGPQATADGGPGDGRADHGMVQKAPYAGRAAPLRSGQPVRQRGLSGSPDGLRHDQLDEPQGQLLGQRPDRERVQQLQEQAHLRQRYATRAEITAETFDYIEVFYNRKRRHSRLGYQSPVQYLADWLMTEEEQKQVA